MRVKAPRLIETSHRVVKYLCPEAQAEPCFCAQTQFQSSSKSTFEKTEKEPETERLLARDKADLRKTLF